MSRIFGDIIQNGYVVRVIEAAMRHWIEVLGVGPWFYIERLAVPDFMYKGQPSPIDVSLALANSGPLQVELIQQRNDAPSLYRDFLNAGHEGLQHIGYGTKNFAADLQRLLDAGYGIGHAISDKPKIAISTSAVRGKEGGDRLCLYIWLYAQAPSSLIILKVSLSSSAFSFFARTMA